MKKKAILLGLAFACVAGLVYAAVEDFSSKVIDIGMVVTDLDESMTFYKDVIGMVQVDRSEFDIDSDFGERSGLTDNLPFHVEVLKLGGGDFATELKLMSFGDLPEKQENEFIHTQTGIQYITIRVTQLEPVIARLEEAGVELLGDTPIELRGRDHFVLVQDPDGTFVELIGPMSMRKRFNVFD